MDRNGILIFHSIHRVMRAEKILKDAGTTVRLMPVPRELSSDCGLSIAFSGEEWETVEGELNTHGCPPEEVYLREGGRYRPMD